MASRKYGRVSDIVEVAREKSLCLFIGTGFSVPFGYPTWKGLLRKIAEDPKVGFKDSTDSLTKADPLEAAEVLHYEFTTKNWSEANGDLEEKEAPHTLSPVHRKLDRQFNEMCMRKIKESKGPRCDDQIQKLKRLPELKARRILTTNYDRVIEEDVYDKCNIQVVREEKDLAGLRVDGPPVLVKLHGDCVELPERAILTHTQYFDFLARRTCLNALVQATFAEYTVLFLGYTFRDVNIHYAYSNYLREYGRAERFRTRAYMVVLEKYERCRLGKRYSLWLSFLRAKNIIPIKWPDELGDFVASVAEKVQAS